MGTAVTAQPLPAPGSRGTVTGLSCGSDTHLVSRKSVRLDAQFHSHRSRDGPLAGPQYPTQVTPRLPWAGAVGDEAWRVADTWVCPLFVPFSGNQPRKENEMKAERR